MDLRPLPVLEGDPEVGMWIHLVYFIAGLLAGAVGGWLAGANFTLWYIEKLRNDQRGS